MKGEYPKVVSFVKFILASRVNGGRWLAKGYTSHDLTEAEYSDTVWKMIEKVPVGDLPKMEFAIFPNVKGWGKMPPIYSERGPK